MIIKQELTMVTTECCPEPFMLSCMPDNSDGYYTILGTKVIEFEFDMPPDVEIRDKKIANLKKARTKAVADFQSEVDGIDDEIKSLMALEAK